MIPKGAIKIDPNWGMKCRSCGIIIYGDPERIRKNHVCKKIIIRRKYILFGKKITKIKETGQKPDLIELSEMKKNAEHKDS